MERDAKYAAVGIFALLAIALAFAFVWWYTDAGDETEYALYEIYFFGTVSGLSQGSPVRYLGVDVGRVRNLNVDRANPGRVKVVTEIDSTAPISGRTRAKLGLLGLTGLLYIDLQEDEAAVAEEPLGQGEEFPVIESRRGDIEAFLARLPDLVGHAGRILERVEVLLADENLAAVSSTLENVRRATNDFPAVARDVQALAADLRATSQEFRALASRLDSTVATAQPQLLATLENMNAAIARLSKASASLERILVDNEASLSQFSGSGLAEMQQLMIDVRDASGEVRDLARSLRENPSSLIRESKESGVELPP
jgi:phospholipid/cholesterol/gamma-HCH transport system substrate-binding protein